MMHREENKNEACANYNALSDEFGQDLVYAAERVNHCYYKRLGRLKQYVEWLLLKPCVFLTLTFRDDVLENTTPQTRRRYVTRYLNSLDCHYVANIDFGEENGREHYHAIVRRSHVEKGSWSHGRHTMKRCYNDDKDVARLSKYINKLANHALKATNKDSRVIYDRYERRDI